MTEYRVRWVQFPSNFHQSQILFVEAESAEAARAVAKDYIERTFGIARYGVLEIDPYVRPTGGRVLA